jgi:hypothetical protein
MIKLDTEGKRVKTEGAVRRKMKLEGRPERYMNGNTESGTWRPEEAEGRGEAVDRKHREQEDSRREYRHTRRGEESLNKPTEPKEQRACANKRIGAKTLHIISHIRLTLTTLNPCNW